MARAQKPVELHPVDEGPDEKVSVVRLGGNERALDRAAPVRLGLPTATEPEEEPAPEEASHRLEMPDRAEIAPRTHQPGIEALIEPAGAEPQLLEQAWGAAGARRGPVPWGWFALIGLAITGAVIWSANQVHESDKVATQLRVETETTLVDEEQEDREARLLVERIERTVKRFFAATTLDAAANLVRQPERVLPLMKAYYGDKPFHESAVAKIRVLQPLTLDNQGNFWMASAVLIDGAERNLVIEIDDQGVPRIDWETLVCHQPMPWDEFAANPPTGTSLDFRVYLEPDHFYSHEFANPEQWTCFRLTALDSEQTVFGYAPAGSEVGRELAGFLSMNGGRRGSAIVRLVVPEGIKARRSAVIEALVSPRWLYLEAPATNP